MKLSLGSVLMILIEPLHEKYVLQERFFFFFICIKVFFVLHDVMAWDTIGLRARRRISFHLSK